nr:MAG: major capsid protein [Microvirus sp.]
MNNLFNTIKLKRPKSNLFDLSHEKKLSCNMGDLIPIMVQEVVPGDKFKVNTEMLMRFAPMIAPVMHRINVFTHYFFVPNRLVYSDWEEFITGGPDGKSEPTFPTLSVQEGSKSLFLKGSLADYMGVPIPPTSGTITKALGFNALPFRAYVEIYNEYYRDQNLQTRLEYNKTGTIDGGDWATLLTLRKRAWEKDYFTSALPWAQKSEEVLLPGTIAYETGSASYLYDADDNELADTAGNLTVDANGKLNTPHEGGQVGRIETEGTLDVTINELRRATKLQEWLEKNARGGSRYIEQIFSHFGVKSSDARLQRPEYLGGGKSPVVISEVLQTSKTDTSPQGNMAGHGISVGNANGFNKYFEEHGFIIGIMSVLPRTSYQQGFPRQLHHHTKFDYYFPEFAHLGEQEIYDYELFVDYLNTSGTYDPLRVFGYTPRYAEYKFNHSTVHGDFKDNLAFWHEGRIFNGPPVLNEDFIKADPSHRIFAVTDPDVHKLYVQLYNDVKAKRPMPKFGTPQL